jgi:hypothetical protein
MRNRDCRQLKARIRQHRTQPEAPTVPAEIRNDTSMGRLESAGLLFAGSPAPERPDVRPLTVEFVAMRLQKAMIQKEGWSAFDPGVVHRCVKSARLTLQETRI